MSLSNTSITFDEKIKFTDLKYDDKSDQITVKATKEYTIANKSHSDEKIKLPSLGLFETLETLSNPELYQQGIIGALYLQKLCLSSDVFIFIVIKKQKQSSIKVGDEIINEPLTIP